MSVSSVSSEILTELSNTEDDFNKLCDSVKKEFYYENCTHDAVSVKRYVHRVRSRLYSLEQLLNKAEEVIK